jgi:hypothetical protein
MSLTEIDAQNKTAGHAIEIARPAVRLELPDLIDR